MLHIENFSTKELQCMSGPLCFILFVAASHRMPLNHLALVVIWAYVCGFHKTITNRKIVLSQLLLPTALQGGSRLKHTPGLFVKRPTYYGHGLKGSILITHTSKNYNFFFPKSEEFGGGSSSYSLSALLQIASISLKEAFVHVGCPSFCDCHI